MVDVIIAARSPELRRSLRALLDSGRIRAVAEDAGVASRSLWPHADVLIIDDPEWLAKRIDPGMPVVVVTNGKRMSRRLSRTRSAGWAIVPLDVSAELLCAAVTAAAQGMIVMPAREAAIPVLDHRDHPSEHDVDGEDGMLEEALTSRELEVLELIASGLTNRQIAERLGISQHTVKFHIATIYGKLGASRRTEAVRRAVYRGLVTL